MEPQLETVSTWLAAGEAADYQTGVLLLQQHSRNRGLVAHLLRKDSPANRNKLVYELLKLSADQVSKPHSNLWQVVFPEAKLPPAPVAPEQPAPADVPEALRPQVDDLTQLMSKLYNQRCQLSNSLADLDPADGPRVVAEILSLESQYNALAEKRRRVVGGEQPAPAEAALGEAPVEPTAAPAVDRAALLQKRANLRSNISKGKAKAKEAKTEAKRSEHTQRVAQLEVELTNVDMQLALPQ